MKSKEERLNDWLDTLSREKLIKVAKDCVEELVLAETVRFWDDTEIPYWDANGENLDGSDENEN